MAGDWIRCRLGDVIELKRGYDLPAAQRLPGNVPIVSSGGISGTHSQAMVAGPGVVTGRYGTIGEVFYIEQDFWPLNTTLYVRDFKGAVPRLSAYFLRTLDFLAFSDKAAVPGVNRNHLHEADVIWPPVRDQQAIADLLGALDAKIVLNQRMVETLEAMARTLFKSWFVDFDPVYAKVWSLARLRAINASNLPRC
jgi:type I restriction enzyme S subunit